MRLLPLLIMVALLAFIVRVGDIAAGIRAMSGTAVAEDQMAAGMEPAAGDTAGSAEGDAPGDTAGGSAPGKEDATSSNAHSSMPKPSDPKKESLAEKDPKAGNKKTVDDPKAKKATGAAAWPDASDMDPDLAKVKSDLYKDLAARRKQLDDRERQLMTREAVLKAAEAEIDQKYQEMTALQDQLKQLLSTQSEQEGDRMKSLVRIYEGMKPADAARIFNTLDLKILLDVISQMSERKSSPILAAMDPDRARVVTLMMAQQKKLPDVPQLIEPQAGGGDDVGGPVEEITPADIPALQGGGLSGDSPDPLLPPPLPAAAAH